MQLDGAQNAEPFSVEISSADGESLFADPRFQMDRASRDPGALANLAHKIQTKISATMAPKTLAPPTLTKLPDSFLESHLPTKVEYEASLKLGVAARFQAETTAMLSKFEATKAARDGTPTASAASSSCGGDDCMDVSDGGCCN